MYQSFKATAVPNHGVPTKVDVEYKYADDVMAVMANTQTIFITKEQAMAFFGLVEPTKE